jgi:hypothetical protein
MSKKTDTTPTELVPSGELSLRTQTALEQLGKKIGPAQLHRLYLAVEQQRGNFTVASIQFGLALLGVKANTEHGKFQDVLSAILSKSEAPASDLNKDDACRQLRSYLMLAKKFLENIESGDSRTAWAAALKVQLPKDVPPGLVIAEHLLSAGDAKFGQALGAFVAGRSLRQMLADFRQADKDAELDELADEQHANRRQRLSPEEQTAARRKEAEQLYFTEFLPKVQECFLCDKPTFENLRRLRSR